MNCDPPIALSLSSPPRDTKNTKNREKINKTKLCENVEKKTLHDFPCFNFEYAARFYLFSTCFFLAKIRGRECDCTAIEKIAENCFG